MTDRRRPSPETAEAMRDSTAALASRRLLAAQLRTGQHSLAPEDFWMTVRTLRERGVMG